MYRSIISIMAVAIISCLAACGSQQALSGEARNASASIEYVTGKAWSDYWGMIAQSSAVVEFEDASGSVFSTTANGMGEWELRLPAGDYEFRVIKSEFLMDPPAGEHIDHLPTKLRLEQGAVIFLGSNLPQYFPGFKIALPITTTQTY